MRSGVPRSDKVPSDGRGGVAVRAEEGQPEDALLSSGRGRKALVCALQPSESPSWALFSRLRRIELGMAPARPRSWNGHESPSWARRSAVDGRADPIDVVDSRCSSGTGPAVAIVQPPKTDVPSPPKASSSSSDGPEPVDTQAACAELVWPTPATDL